jgi:crotonobetainyl-CoA:carnitine CoA-transferase CaiB-like acyl-CoA transferase
MLDLQDPADRQQAIELALGADVVISNFSPATALGFGLDAAALMAQNPRLIYAQLHAYPDETDQRPAFDVVLQAETGFMSMNGEPERPAVKMPVAFIDLLAAHQLKEGILLALWQREKTGRGALVRTSLFESAVASLANQATNWLMAGHLPGPMGSQHPNIAPYGDQLRCANGEPIVLAVGTERHFERLCAVLGEPEKCHDPRFQNNSMRVLHRSDLLEWLSSRFREQDIDHWMAALHLHGVPAAPIRNLQELFEHPDAQAMVLDSTEENVPTRRVRSVAFQLTYFPE